MRVATVYKSGGIYTAQHVRALQAQIAEHLPGVDQVCFSDVDGDGRIRLRHNWPGWWSKMEIFSPDVKGDLLYFDLDTLILGSLAEIAQVTQLTILRDFYRDGVRKPEGLQSAMMFLPEADRAEVWDAFARNPAAAMRDCARGGDQQFLERFYLKRAARWQDVVPGQVVSLKVHCKDGVPPDARVVCAHGKPKMWHLPEYQKYYA